MRTVSLVVIGSEITDGYIADTNSAFLIEALNRHGVRVGGVVTCPDSEEKIIRAVEHAATHSTHVIVTGGLGPTSDDLTRESVASMIGVQLVLDEGALRELEARFRARGRVFDPANRKQALFPEGACILRNPVGTAAGFEVRVGGVTLFSLPGAPRELRAMFGEHVLPRILAGLEAGEVPAHRAFQVFGIPEATIGSSIERLELPSDIGVSYRASGFVVTVVLKSKAANCENPESWYRDAIRIVGEDSVFSTIHDGTLEGTVDVLLKASGATLSVAESCTGGLLGGLLTRTPGSSTYFQGGAITYSNELKTKLLGVSPECIAAHGAVSEETAIEMAKGARNFGADLGLSITGIAGPGGGSEEKPVGTFFLGYADKDSAFALRFFAPYERDLVRRYAALQALDLLRRKLTGKPLPRPYRPREPERN